MEYIKVLVHRKICVNQRHLRILLSNHPWFDNDTGIVTLKNKKDNFISNRMRGERDRERGEDRRRRENGIDKE